METITQAGSRLLSSVRSGKSSKPSTQCRNLQSSEYKALLVKFNPSAQMRLCGDAKNCVTGNYPTLADIRKRYGQSAGCLVPHLAELAVFCGCKDKLSEQQLVSLSAMLATEYHYLKISEFMLFFWWFKLGRYGKFYGTVDPMVITTAFRDFLSDRAEVIAAEEDKARQKQLESARENAITYEEYLKMKNNA